MLLASSHPPHLHPNAMPAWLTCELRGERTASAMETQLTALERKIDDLLATIASPEAPGLDKDNATTELVNNATDARGAQPEEK